MKQKIIICLTGDLSTDYRVHKTAMSLIKMGYDVCCVSRYMKGFGTIDSRDYNYRILKTIFKKGPLFYAEINLRQFIYLLLHRSEAVVAIDLDTLAGCWLGSRFGKRKLIYDSHEYFPEVPELQHRPIVKNIWIKLEAFLVPKVDKAYTVCESIADIYYEKYQKRFSVVRNMPLSSRIDKQESVIKDQRFKVVYQGAVNIGRGIFETLEAMKLMDDVVFVLIGDGDEMKQVQSFVEQQGLCDRVEILGKISFLELGAYTQSADIGLCLLENIGLNYYYSLPNRIFDFALVGVPILASNFPEIAKIVGGESTGVLIDDLKPETIANAISKLQEDKELYRKLADNAIKASQKLTWEQEEDVLKKIYLE